MSEGFSPTVSTRSDDWRYAAKSPKNRIGTAGKTEQPWSTARSKDCHARAVAFTSNSTCRLYESSNGIHVFRHGDLVLGIELAAPDQHAFAAAQIDTFEVKAAEPLMPMPFGEPEEQAFDLGRFDMPTEAGTFDPAAS